MSNSENPITRELLHRAYIYTVASWAVDTREVAANLETTNAHADALLRKLQSKNLVESEHINNEKNLTWQSYYDADNDNRHNWETLANADFNEAFPGETIETSQGGGGARYTIEQISLGVEVRKAGGTWREAAAAAGLGPASAYYFSTVLKARGIK